MNPDGTYGTIDEFRDHLAMLLDRAQRLAPALVRVRLSLALQKLMDAPKPPAESG
jgi:hypothetical protein